MPSVAIWPRRPTCPRSFRKNFPWLYRARRPFISASCPSNRTRPLSMMMMRLHSSSMSERSTVLLTTHDLSDIEELCKRIIIIDKGRVLFDGQLAEMKGRLARYNQVKFFLKDRGQVGRLGQIATDGISCERVDELTYLLRFDRHQHSSAEVIREIVNQLEVRDIFIEEEPIEDIVKRIYLSGEVG